MSLGFPEHENFLVFAEELADASGRLLLAAADERPAVSLKADASYVTSDGPGDRNEDCASMIEARYPEHGIFGEEFPGKNIDADLVWVLDPIDGTAAFIAGIPVYGTLIALAWRGRPFLGVIDHPKTSRIAGSACSDCFARHNGCDHKDRRHRRALRRPLSPAATRISCRRRTIAVSTGCVSGQPTCSTAGPAMPTASWHPDG